MGGVGYILSRLRRRLLKWQKKNCGVNMSKICCYINTSYFGGLAYWTAAHGWRSLTPYNDPQEQVEAYGEKYVIEMGKNEIACQKSTPGDNYYVSVEDLKVFIAEWKLSKK
jgi:hypothetical protein